MSIELRQWRASVLINEGWDELRRNHVAVPCQQEMCPQYTSARDFHEPVRQKSDDKDEDDHEAMAQRMCDMNVVSRHQRLDSRRCFEDRLMHQVDRIRPKLQPIDEA